MKTLNIPDSVYGYVEAICQAYCQNNPEAEDAKTYMRLTNEKLNENGENVFQSEDTMRDADSEVAEGTAGTGNGVNDEERKKTLSSPTPLTLENKEREYINNFFNAQAREESAKSSRKKSKPYDIPTLEQVQEYHKKRNFTNFTAEEFFDYFETRGWVLNNGLPIHDWKACMRNTENMSIKDILGLRKKNVNDLNTELEAVLDKNWSIEGMMDEQSRQYLEYFDPKNQQMFGMKSTINEWMDSKTHTLEQCVKELGYGVVIRVIARNLLDLCQFAGASVRRFNVKTIVGVSRIIVCTYSGLKTCELMIAFQQIKEAKYGELNERMTQANLMSKLRKFQKWRTGYLNDRYRYM